MGSPKLTGFLIALTLFSFFVGVFGLYYSELNNKYAVGYEEANIEVFNKLDEMHNRTETYQSRVRDLGSSSNIITAGVDIIGAFVGGAKDMILDILDSINIFTLMLTGGMDELNSAGLGAFTGYLQKMVMAIVFILAIIGIVLGKVILKKSDL